MRLEFAGAELVLRQRHISVDESVVETEDLAVQGVLVLDALAL